MTERETIFKTLFELFRLDMERDGTGLCEDVPNIIARHATTQEKELVVGWIEQELPKSSGYSKREFQKFLDFLIPS